MYRDEEIAHRFLADQHDRVLALATPDRLRQSLLDLRPSATVRDHALLALRSATLTDEPSVFLRMLVFLNELWLRGMVLETEPFAAAVHQFDPQLALEHIVRGGQLRIKPGAALDHAVDFAAGDDVDAAQRIVRACGGLAGMTDGEDLLPSAVADWAELTWQLSGLDAVLAELDHHLPHPPAEATLSADLTETPEEQTDTVLPEGLRRQPLREQQLQEKREHEANIINCRNLAHARCFDLLVETRDDEALENLTSIIDAEASPGWRARARCMRAKAASEDRAWAEVMRWVREIIAIDANSSEVEKDDEELPAHGANPAVPLSVRIAAAELLVRNGFTDAPEIDQLLPPGTAVVWPSTVSGQEGLEPFQTLIGLNRLRQIRPDPTHRDPMPPAKRSSREAGNERFRGVLHTLAELEGQQLAADAGLGEPPMVAAHANPIIRLLEVPLEETRDWTSWYIVQNAALDPFRRIVDLAAKSGGNAGLTRLLELFDDAWTTPDRARYWTPERQQAVITAVINAHADVLPWALEQLERLDAAINTRSNDPHDRVSLWLTQAQAWATAGNPTAARQAAQSAVRASLRIGASEHDRQLDEWLGWLDAAVDNGQLTTTEFVAKVRAYASRIASATPEATSQAKAATETLIALTFPRNVSLACDLAEWLCESGAFSEADAIQAVVLAACRHPDIPLEDGVAAAVHLLYPIMHKSPQDITETVQARSIEDSGNAAAALRHTEQIWTVHETRPDVTGEEQEQEEPEGARTEASDKVPQIETIGALLTALRNATTARNSPQGGWDQAVECTASGVVSPTMARTLLEQASRLHLGGAALGGLAALAARSGEAELAAATLADDLSRMPGYGWLRHYDGGTRLSVFDAALHDRHPVLIQLARHDLATSFATGSLSGQLSPDNIRRIVALVAGPEIITSAWPGIETYLDEVAPAGSDISDLPTSTAAASSSVEAFARWVARYLGHPVRPLDFGARWTLQLISRHHEHAGQRVLAEAITQGGWACEAALMALITTPGDERPTKLSSDLVAAVRGAVVEADGICRDLARRLAHQYRVHVLEPSHRPLPASYKLTLPPLPERTLPELDRQGTPHLDPHNPQHLLAPFDVPLRVLAKMSELEPSAVLYRAAAIAEASDERWIHGGHHAQADLLKGRQQFHTYHPWAFMAGRRALGLVLGELLDAGALSDLPVPPAYYIGLVGERIAGVEPQPVPSSVPSPWRPEGAQAYSVQGWCTETQQAVQEYKNVYSTAMPYVLAEYCQWRSLEWSRPEEERRVYATHRDAPVGPLLLPAEPAWETAFLGAHRYPDHLELDWSHEELVVHGHEDWTDTPHIEWLAFHPAVGTQLGWQHDPQELFT